MVKLKIKKYKKKQKKKQTKIKPITCYILCKNKQIKKYMASVSRKFNLNDETYVIKENCCYLKKVNGFWEMVSFYIEGNPNPFDLKDIEANTGLNETELDSYIGGDLFNILIECQEKDRSIYVVAIAVVCLIYGTLTFVMELIL